MASLESRKERLDKRKQRIIRNLLNDIESSLTMDIVFLIDGTGSMAWHIAKVKETVRRVVSNINEKYTLLEFFFNVIIYRDHGDTGDSEGTHTMTMGLTKSIDRLEGFLDSVSAGGGGDSAEDVLHGLGQVCKTQYHRKSTRLLIHFADAPCHGVEFHEEDCDDDHKEYKNEVDRTGVALARNILVELRNAEFIYHFIRITRHTDKMISKFHDIMKSTGVDCEYPQVLECENVEFVAELLEKSITSSYLASVETMYEPLDRITADNGNLSDIELLSPKEPISIIVESLDQLNQCKSNSESNSWARLPTHSVECLTCVPIESESKAFETVQLASPKRMNMKIKFTPIGEGTSRIAYEAREVGQDKELIVKLMKGKGASRLIYSEGLLERQKDTIYCSAVAQYFAKKFNEERPRGKKSIRFLPATLVYLNKPCGTRILMTCEEKLQGRFVKWTANVICGCTTQNIDELSAFSHFTYQESNQRLMITDLQGVETESEYILTDPCVLCSDNTPYRPTNLGIPGMQKYLSMHRCNEICTYLDLFGEPS